MQQSWNTTWKLFLSHIKKTVFSNTAQNEVVVSDDEHQWQYVSVKPWITKNSVFSESVYIHYQNAFSTGNLKLLQGAKPVRCKRASQFICQMMFLIFIYLFTYGWLFYLELLKPHLTEKKIFQDSSPYTFFFFKQTWS